MIGLHLTHGQEGVKEPCASLKPPPLFGLARIGPKLGRNLPGIGAKLARIWPESRRTPPGIGPKFGRNPPEIRADICPDPPRTPTPSHGLATSGRIRIHLGGFGQIGPDSPQSGFTIWANWGQSAPIGAIPDVILEICPKSARNSPQSVFGHDFLIWANWPEIRPNPPPPPP